MYITLYAIEERRRRRRKAYDVFFYSRKISFIAVLYADRYKRDNKSNHMHIWPSGTYLSLLSAYRHRLSFVFVWPRSIFKFLRFFYFIEIFQKRLFDKFQFFVYIGNEIINCNIVIREKNHFFLFANSMKIFISRYAKKQKGFRLYLKTQQACIYTW